MKAGKKLTILAAIFCVSCSSRINNELEADNRLRMSAFQTDFAEADSTQNGANGDASTKATEAKFQNGDAVGLFVHTAASVAGSGNHSANLKYFTIDAGVKWQAASSLSSSLNVGGTYYSTAYYPYKQGVANALTVEHSVATDQSTAAGDKANNLEMSDFMIAPSSAITVKSISEANVVLGFKHVMTKLVVSVSIPTSIEDIKVSSIKSITIKGTNTDCTVNLSNNVVTAKTNTVKDITPRLCAGNGTPGTLSSWEAIVVPQTVAAATKMVEFICIMADGSEKALSYTTPAASSLKLIGGNKTNLTLSSSADLAFLSTVSFIDGTTKSDVGLDIKAATGVSWSVSSAADWLTVSNTAGGAYSNTITGTGTSAAQTIYIKVAENSGILAIAREAALTLSATAASSGTPAGSMTYKVFQNYTLFAPPTTAWNLSAGASQVQALAAFTTNQVWTANVSNTTPALGLTLAASIGGSALTLPYEVIGSLADNSIYMQVPTVNNTNAARTGKVVMEIKDSNPKQIKEIAVSQAAPVLALSAAQTVMPHITTAAFNVTANGQNGVIYTPKVGDNTTSVSPNTAQTIGVAGAYTSPAITANFAANTGAQRQVKVNIGYGASLNGEYIITQEAAALTLNTYAASVAANVTYYDYTLTSNVPYTSACTGNSASTTNATGSSPKYTNLAMRLSFAAQGASAAAARNQTVTFTPNPNNSASSQVRTLTVTQAAVQPTLTISAAAPGEIAPAAGKTYYVNVASNTYWNTSAATNVSVSPSSGTGDVNSVAITVPATTTTASLSSTRAVSVQFNTASGLGLTETSSTWSGAQAMPTWTTGNLVANGANGCRIGAATDEGLVFPFGSLVGWNSPSAGDPAAIVVRPSGYSSTVAWPGGYTSSGEILADNAAAGTGDPCRYYLGAAYRLPTSADIAALVATGSTWSTPYRTFGSTLLFRASGYRYINGEADGVDNGGDYWSSTPSFNYGDYLYFNSSHANFDSDFRNVGRSLRCIKM